MNGRHEGPAVDIVQPVGYLTRLEPDPDLPFDEWVTGIVIPSPFRQGAPGPPLQIPATLKLLADSDVLVCDLPEHYPRDAGTYTYEARGFEYAWTSDAMVCRAIADWKRAQPSHPG